MREAKRISGFDHTMIYRFDEDGHGQVLAEECDPGVPSYLGLRFPASDIPAQARRLYLANRIRVIGNAYYQPSPLQPQTNPLTGQPLDLSFAQLRSVSPVHLQYMRNMGTLASMSISIVVGDRLWGLVLCHDRQPQRVSFQKRVPPASCSAGCCRCRSMPPRPCGIRSPAGAAPIHGADALDHGRPRQRLPGTIGAAAGLPGFRPGAGRRHHLLRRDRADRPGTTARGGGQPGRVAVGQRQGPLVTDNLAKDIAELPQLAQHAAGVLAVPISELHSTT